MTAVSSLLWLCQARVKQTIDRWVGDSHTWVINFAPKAPTLDTPNTITLNAFQVTSHPSDGFAINFDVAVHPRLRFAYTSMDAEHDMLRVAWEDQAALHALPYLSRCVHLYCHAYSA